MKPTTTTQNQVAPERPRLLDLFSGAGGAARGYQLAGFHVTGVDIVAQKRYIGDEFHQADALEYLAAHGHEYDVIHASPPCQAHSTLRHRWSNEYDSLIGDVRSMLQKIGKPYVIENVVGAPLRDPLMLCGSMFNLRVIRHRLFECSPAIYFPPGPCSHPVNAVGRRGHLADREWMTVTGHFSNVVKAGEAMGIDWMTQSGLAQAIPPAYTEWIGELLLQAVSR